MSALYALATKIIFSYPLSGRNFSHMYVQVISCYSTYWTPLFSVWPAYSCIDRHMVTHNCMHSCTQLHSFLSQCIYTVALYTIHKAANIAKAQCSLRSELCLVDFQANLLLRWFQFVSLFNPHDGMKMGAPQGQACLSLWDPDLDCQLHGNRKSEQNEMWKSPLYCHCYVTFWNISFRNFDC